MKQRVYNPKPTNKEQLRENIEREFKYLKPIFDNLKKKCSLIISKNGRHIEHL